VPDLQPPSTIIQDITPGVNQGTNESMPRFGGRVEPGQQVVISVDGNETTIAPTPDGTWTYTSPELGNGDHEFGLWTEDAHGNTSDKLEWENNIQADAADRAVQRQRNDRWRNGEAEQFLNGNDQLARDTRRPPTATGGGSGGGQQPMTDPVPPTPSSGGRTATGQGMGGGSGQTDGPTGTPPTAQGLEKGNAGTGQAVAR
jgi:hypothetical protein